MKTPHVFYKEENKFHTLYTLQRAKKDDTLYGSIHGSEDGDKTICGIEADYNWWIKTNDFTGEITCKKCLKELERLLK